MLVFVQSKEFLLLKLRYIYLWALNRNMFAIDSWEMMVEYFWSEIYNSTIFLKYLHNKTHIPGCVWIHNSPWMTESL